MNLREFVENNPRLVVRKASLRHPGLYVLKYHNRVFYDNLWTPELEECRGTVVDEDWQVVVRPFRKIYNRHERGTDIPRDEIVTAVRKVNGFMGAVTWSPLRNEIIYSTTGSLDSDYAVLVEQHLKNFVPSHHYARPVTWLFEICDASDPHIIKERPGAYLIGGRDVETGELLSEEVLDSVAEAQGFKRPDWWRGQFSDVVNETKRCTHEGFVVYGQDTALKIKSPYYLTKKLFARLNPARLTSGWIADNKAQLEEEYFPLADHIAEHRVTFAALAEQDRLKFIEDFISEN